MHAQIQAPVAWKGEWGKDSSKWTFELKRQLGMVNSSNVEMHDATSVFWMCWDDLVQHFMTIEVCRCRHGWNEVRLKGWLPSGVGPGDQFELSLDQSCEVDLSLVQVGLSLPFEAQSHTGNMLCHVKTAAALRLQFFDGVAIQQPSPTPLSQNVVFSYYDWPRCHHAGLNYSILYSARQEGHITREAGLGLATTNVDIGFGVIAVENGRLAHIDSQTYIQTCIRTYGHTRIQKYTKHMHTIRTYMCTYRHKR